MKACIGTEKSRKVKIRNCNKVSSLVCFADCIMFEGSRVKLNFKHPYVLNITS